LNLGDDDEGRGKGGEGRGGLKERWDNGTCAKMC
jgi:hypothetical protein